MILGIGVDIVRTARFAQMLAKHPHRLSRLQQRILHPTEIPAIPRSTAETVRLLASSWASKEAVYKSLPPSEQKSCIFSQWRREFTPRGQEMRCDLTAFANQEVLVTISHDGEYTIAYVIRQQKP